MIEAGIEGLGKGATFGALPYLQAAAEKAITIGGSMGRDMGSPMSELVRQYRERGAGLREQHPGITLTGELVGGFAPGHAISKGVGLVASAIPKAQAIATAAPTVGKIARGATEGAVMGAAYTPDEGADLERRLEQAKFGTLVGGAIPAAIAGVGGAGKIVKAGATKAFSAVTGVKEDVLREFASDPQKYLNAPSRQEIVANVTKVVNDLDDKVRQGQIAVEDAKQIYRESIASLKSERTDKYKEASEALRYGLRNLDEAYKGVVNDLKAKPAPTSLQPQVSSAISDLKNLVQQGSDESYKILENDKGAYGIRSAGKVLRDMADQMDIQPWTNEAASTGKDLAARVNHAGPVMQASRPVTAESRGVQNTIRAFAKMLEQTPEAVPAKELKKILQQIDNSGRAQYGQPGFDSRVSQAYKLVRKVIDEGIKSKNPEYRAKMIEVAQNTGLLDESIAAFGSPDKAISKLASIASPKGKLTAETLNKLGQATGNDFDSPIRDYIETQSLLKNPQKLEGIKRGLPEFVESQKLAKAAKQAEFAKDPREIVRLSKNSMEKRSLDFAGNELNLAKEIKGKAIGWTEGNVNEKINAVMRGKDFIKGQLSELGKLGNQDFVDQVNKLRVNEAFTKTNMNGSRNVNFWSLMGFGAAGGGGPGAMIGAATGMLMDKYGPAVAKNVILGISKIKSQPTVQSLMKAGITSQKVAQELADDFAKAVGVPAQSLNADAITRRLIGENEKGENNFASK
jgi:hypothetical protein